MVTTITTKLLTDSSHARADRWMGKRETEREREQGGRRTRRTALKILLHTLSSSGSRQGRQWQPGVGSVREGEWVLATRAVPLEGCQLPVVHSCPFTCPHGGNKKAKTLLTCDHFYFTSWLVFCAASARAKHVPPRRQMKQKGDCEWEWEWEWAWEWD